MLRKIDEEEKVTNNICTIGGSQKEWFLTKDGMYEVLMQSKKAGIKVNYIYFIIFNILKIKCGKCIIHLIYIIGGMKMTKIVSSKTEIKTPVSSGKVYSTPGYSERNGIGENTPTQTAAPNWTTKTQK